MTYYQAFNMHRLKHRSGLVIFCVTSMNKHDRKKYRKTYMYIHVQHWIHFPQNSMHYKFNGIPYMYLHLIMQHAIHMRQHIIEWCDSYFTIMHQCNHSSLNQGCRQAFSRGGLQASPGDGSQLFFKFQGRWERLPLRFGRCNGQNKGIFRARGRHGPPLPMAAYVYGLSDPNLVAVSGHNTTCIYIKFLKPGR